MTQKFVRDLTMSLKLANNVFPVFLVLLLCSSPGQSVAALSVSYREDGSPLVSVFHFNV